MDTLKFFFPLLILFSSFQVKGSDYNSWISKELEYLPRRIKVSFPDLRIDIDSIDQKELSLRNNPMRRNTYINENYAVIANELNRC